MTDFHAKALFAYEAVEESELAINEGDIVTVKEVNDSGWCLAELGERSGWVPSDYIEKIEDGGDAAPAAPEPEPVEHIPIIAPVAAMSIEDAAPPAPAPTPAADPTPAAPMPVAAAASTPPPAPAAGGGAANPTGAPICHSCKEPVVSAFVVAKDKTFHVDHFNCAECSAPLAGKPFIEKDGLFYCEADYYKQFNPKCGHCDEIIKGQYITALEQSWHVDHFVCTTCSQPFQGNEFRKHENKPYCEAHFNELFAVNCDSCGTQIKGQAFEALDKKYHLECFKCEVGGHLIGESSTFHAYNEKIYCPAHFEELFLQKCVECTQNIVGQYIKIGEKHYHPDCWKCGVCSSVMQHGQCDQYGGAFYCKPCHAKIQSGEIQAPGGGGVAAAAAQQQVDAAAAAAAAQAQARAAADAEAAAAAAAQQQSFDAEKEAAAAHARLQAAAQAAQAASAGGAEVPFAYFALDELNNKQVPKGVDKMKKEWYLRDDEFERLFKMDKAAFYSVPKWKQKKLKTNFALY